MLESFPRFPKVSGAKNETLLFISSHSELLSALIRKIELTIDTIKDMTRKITPVKTLKWKYKGIPEPRSFSSTMGHQSSYKGAAWVVGN